MEKKDLRKAFEDASEAWINEDPQGRNIMCFMGDKELNITSCGIHGREDHLAETLVNEMVADESLAKIIIMSVDIYKSLLAEEVQEKTKEIKPKFLS